MALLIFLIGVVFGWLVRPPSRAAAVTVAVGLAALVALGGLWLSDVQVSPLETVVLIIGTPIAAAVAFKLSEWRLARRSHSG